LIQPFGDTSPRLSLANAISVDHRNAALRWDRSHPGNARPEQVLEEHLAMPCETQVLGVAVTVQRLDMTDEEQIVAVCARGKSRQRVPVLDLPLPSLPPDGSEWIEAYRRWRHGS
jgi:hypothetical protein